MKHFPATPHRPRSARVLACAAVLVGVVAIVPWKVVAQQAARDRADEVANRTVTAPAEKSAEQPAEQPAEKGRAGDAPAAGVAPAERGYLKSLEVNLAAATDGIVTRVGAQEGEPVKKGQLLVEIDARKAALGVQAAEARLAEAEGKIRRVNELLQKKQASPAEVEEVEMQRQQAQIELRLRQSELDETRVSAPIDGALERVSVRPGEYVARGGELARVVGLDAFWVDIMAPVATANRLKPGGGAALQLKGPQTGPLKGRVRYVSNVVRSGSQTTLVCVDVLDPPPGLKPGTEVDVSFEGVK